MKVILLKDDRKLGKKNEIIEVSDGYARNQLIPKGIVLPATNDNLNNIKLKTQNEERIEAARVKEAKAEKEIIEAKKIILHIKAGETGRAFGSITSKEIAESIKENFNIDVDKKKIDIEDGIKNIGNYEIKVKLHRDVEAILKMQVESE